jgi:copper chaperone CopZ
MHERFPMTTITERSYRVYGMTCEHCRTAVSEELLRVEGVQGVEVDLDAGRVVVSGRTVNDESVRTAVDEAGYEVVA